MVISILGYSGFIGSSILKKLNSKYKVKKINVRKINFGLSEKKICKIISQKTKNSKFVINCCANLKPKNHSDFFLNEKFQRLVQKSILNLKHKVHFIHFSTLNVLLSERIDIYTISKRNGERNLKKKNTIILRLPIIIQSNPKEKNKGNFNFFEKYLDLKFLSFFPMISPGHVYQPIEINDLCRFVESLIKRKNNSHIYNLVGKEKKSLWDIFSAIAKRKNKKSIKIDTSFFAKIIPFFKNSQLIRNNDFLSQFFSIDHSKIKTQKLINL